MELTFAYRLFCKRFVEKFILFTQVTLLPINTIQNKHFWKYSLFSNVQPMSVDFTDLLKPPPCPVYSELVPQACWFWLREFFLIVLQLCNQICDDFCQHLAWHIPKSNIDWVASFLILLPQERKFYFHFWSNESVRLSEVMKGRFCHLRWASMWTGF